MYCKKLSERIVYSKQWSNVLRSDFNICDLYSEVKRKDINCSYQEHWIVHYLQQRLTHSLCITTVILEVNYIAVVLTSRTNVTSVGSAVKITKTIWFYYQNDTNWTLTFWAKSCRIYYAFVCRCRLQPSFDHTITVRQDCFLWTRKFDTNSWYIVINKVITWCCHLLRKYLQCYLIAWWS